MIEFEPYEWESTPAVEARSRLARHTSSTSEETSNDPTAYEFYGGRDLSGSPIWTSEFGRMRPLLEWPNNMGCVTVTYNPPLGRFLMAVTDGGVTCGTMSSYILESDDLTGPWRLVSYLKEFGEQAYVLNFPSKFVSSDGHTMWLCYSGNFAPDWNDTSIKENPPGTSPPATWVPRR
jgi:hypothetical protein